MYLFFDTETTGFPRKDTHARDPSQARVCQMALLLTEEDGTVRGSFSTLIKPDGWNVGEKASEITGITDELCEAYGINSATAVDIFIDACSAAEQLVAHNLAFDTQMMGIECQAWAHDFPEFDNRTCTMLKSANSCKLPDRYDNYKNPKLDEALKILCDRELGDSAHDAMADTMACKDIFFELKKQGVI